MKTAILIDSGCDVSDELVQKYHHEVMPLHIIYPRRITLTELIFFGNDLSEISKEIPSLRQVHRTLKIWWRK